MAPRAAIAAGDRETAAAGAALLAEGGGAVDAVLGAMLAACVAEPVLCSLGGGGFLAVAPADGPPAILDFFAQTPGRAPDNVEEADFRAIEADFGTAKQVFHIGPAAAAVPGIVPGLFEAHRAHGRLPLARIVEPAARLARDGAVLSAMQARILTVVAPIMTATANARALYADPADPTRPVAAGHRLRNPAFADALEALAREGEGLWRAGALGRAAIRALGPGGLIDLEDLARYRARWRAPYEMSLAGATVRVPSHPSCGGVLTLAAMAAFRAHGGLSETDAPARARALSRALLEATRLRRASGLAEAMSPDAVARAARLLGLEDPAGRADPPGALKRGGTTHVSAVDARGTLACLSVSNGEGAGIVLPEAGFMLNNMLGEEDLYPGGFFTWTPDTRVGSMMTPAVLTARTGARIALGSGGSNRIRSAIPQVLLRLLGDPTALDAALRAPRLHWEGGHLHIEGGFDAAVLDALRTEAPARTEWPDRDFFFGGVHAVGIAPDGRVMAAGDGRRDGHAVLV